MELCVCRCGRFTPCPTRRTRATATPSMSSSAARKSSQARSASMMPPCSQVLHPPVHPWGRLRPTSYHRHPTDWPSCCTAHHGQCQALTPPTPGACRCLVCGCLAVIITYKARHIYDTRDPLMVPELVSRRRVDFLGFIVQGP